MKLANFQISLNRQLLYYTFHDDNSLRQYANLYDISKEKNKVKGKFSNGAKKRLTKIIDLFTSSIAGYLLYNKIPLSNIDRYIKFVTLTLSSAQFHSDTFIRRNMLNVFLLELKRKHNVKSFIYCSEAQKNGNIHFHILINQYIHWKKIREIWNKIQENNGYIESFEKKFGHKNPNSIDIHKLKKVNSLAAYLTKYFTKDENRRKIEGRLWGCSDNLRELKYYEKLVDYEVDNYLNEMFLNHRDAFYQTDFFVILKSEKFVYLKEKLKDTYDDMIRFYYVQSLAI